MTEAGITQSYRHRLPGGKSPIRFPTPEPISSHTGHQRRSHEICPPNPDIQQWRTSDNLDQKPLIRKDQTTVANIFRKNQQKYIAINNTSKQYGPGNHSSLNNTTRDRSPIRFPALTPGAQNINNQDNKNGSDITNLEIRQDFCSRRHIRIQGEPSTTTQQDFQDRERVCATSKSTGCSQGHQHPHESQNQAHLDWNKEQHPHSNRNVRDLGMEDSGNTYCQVAHEGYLPRIPLPQPLRSNNPVAVWGEVNTFLMELAKDIDKAKNESQGQVNKFGHITTGCNLPTCRKLSYTEQSSDKEKSHNADTSNKIFKRILPWIPGMEPHHIPQIDFQTQSRQDQQNERPGEHHLSTLTDRAMIKRKGKMHRSAGAEDRLNFHRNQQDIIIKTSAGHPRCNYTDGYGIWY